MKNIYVTLLFLFTLASSGFSQAEFNSYFHNDPLPFNHFSGAVLSLTGESHKEPQNEAGLQYDYYAGAEIAYQVRGDNTYGELFYRFRHDGSSRTGVFLHLDIPGFLFNAKWKNPDRSVNLLFGAGMVWDGLLGNTDYPIDLRIVVNWDRLVITARGGRNLIESFYYGPVRERSITVGYKFGMVQ